MILDSYIYILYVYYVRHPSYEKKSLYNTINNLHLKSKLILIKN